jgi:hypothetical protein
MIRLAVCVEQGRKEQWFVSAVGDTKCHAYGAALEYFSCTAAAASEEEQGSEQQVCGSHELRTAALAEMLWRPLELHTLHILKQPAKPVRLPLVEEEGDGAGSCVVVRRLGFWCDASDLPSEDTEKLETCTIGSQLYKPSVRQLSGDALAAARIATLEELLTPTELREVQALAAETAAAAAARGAGRVLLLDPQARPGGASLTKKDRTRLYDAIGSLESTLRCTLLDEVGQPRMIKVWRDETQASTVPSAGADDTAGRGADAKQAAVGGAECKGPALDAVEFGMLQLVELTDDAGSYFCPHLPKDTSNGTKQNDDKLVGTVVATEASATAARLNALLKVFEGKAGHSFHNFSTSLTASQRKCKRQVTRAMCSGSFLLRREEGSGCSWAVLTLCSAGFLYRQIQHMVGCGEPPIGHLFNTLSAKRFKLSRSSRFYRSIETCRFVTAADDSMLRYACMRSVSLAVVAVACGAVPTEHLLFALRGGSGNGAGGGGGGEILRTPRAPIGTLSLVSCCYCRKLPRKDTKPIWVGPRAATGTGGLRQGFSGPDRAALLDWRASLHNAQMRRYDSSSSGGARGGGGQGLGAWCGELRAAAQEMWTEAATQEALASRSLGAVRVGVGPDGGARVSSCFHLSSSVSQACLGKASVL